MEVGRARQRVMLIVDDDPGTLGLLREIFADEGFETIPCPDLASAMRALKAGLPDIALIDFSLPDGLGIQLRDRLEGRDVPCLIVSAYPTWLHRAVHPEPNWVSKPFAVEEIVGAVRERLGESVTG